MTFYSQEGFQERRFTYDSRGFLLSERHPEKGAFGNGLVRYFDYDSRGQPGRVVDGSHQMENVYDDLGRLTQVWDGSHGRLFVERFYSKENEGADKSAGKLAVERRHNYLAGSNEDLVVTQTYQYSEAQGRLSRLRTRATPGLDVAQDFTYDALGNREVYGFPLQDMLPNVGDPDLQARAAYQLGRLVGLDFGYGGQSWDPIVQAMAYGPTGSVVGRQHANGVVDRQQLDPTGLARPHRLFTEGVFDGLDWSSGAYAYDGSGNISAMGSNSFAYDGVQRLKQAQVAGIEEAYAYDRFGNLLALGQRGRDIDIATNRVADGTHHYDDNGNVLWITGAGPTRAYTYDLFNRATSMTEAGQTELYVYGPGHERIAVLHENGHEQWTLRDSSQQPAREYSRENNGPWTVRRDYLYADQRVASLRHDAEGDTIRHYHLDHLGSSRLVTDSDGKKVSGHTFMPFGEEIADLGNPIPDGERLKFTGHERDGVNQDYMHARFYGALEG